MDKKSLHKIIREAFQQSALKESKILNPEEEIQFNDWLEDGNVSKNSDGTFSTQDAQYKNSLKDKEELKQYFYDNFLRDYNSLKSYFSEEEEIEEGSARNFTNKRGVNLKPANYPLVKKIEESIEFELVTEDEDKRKTDRYMFISNLKQICRQAELILSQDIEKLEQILDDGHDWAQDHIAVAKENVDQVFDFLMNKLNSKDSDNEVLDIDLKSDEEEIEEGSARNFTNRKGKNIKPYNLR